MQSSKRGKTSSSAKQGNTRYGFRPIPATTPQHGAFGHGDIGSERDILAVNDPELVAEGKV